MRRNIFFSLILFLLLLPACGVDSVQVRGLVTEVQTGPDGALTAFVVQTKDKGQVGVLLTGDTFAAPSGSGSWTGSEMQAEFQAELLPDVSISAVCLPSKKKLTAQDGQEIAAYEADHVSINGRLNRGAAALADGTALDVLEDNNPVADRTYLLPGGAELLWVRGPSGPEHCYVGGLESFDDLSARAREKVSAWYEDRGPLFDEAAELEKAVTDAEGAAAKSREELAEVERQVTSAETANASYTRLQSEIAVARLWLDKEKQLPVAREQKSAAAQRVLELGEEIEDIEKEITEARTELATEQAKTVGREELQAQVDGAEAEIGALQELARGAAMKLGGLKAQAEQAEKKLAEAAELQGQVNALAGKAAGYEELKKAFSQDGIPHNIIRSIIPIFEATATNILGQMSQGRMSVEFVTEKVLKSNAKKEVTTLDIIINDSDTGRLPYMSRSGGERVKAALSVILALSEIKSSKAGVQLGFLFIDEPPFLDGPGVQAYCDALEAIQQRYGSLKVMAITHDPAMKSRFPQSVDVVKTAEGSKVIYE